MIIDTDLTKGQDSGVLFTISQPVLQRLLDGKTLGLAIRPLGAVNASFYSKEYQGGELGAALHFDVE